MWSSRLNPTAIFFVLSLVLFGAPQAAANQHEWQTYYGGDTDETLSLRLGQNRARIIIGSERCLGEFWGVVTRHSDHISLTDPNPRGRLLAPECEFELWPLINGGYRIEQGNGCTAYHGAMCDLSGVVSPVIASSVAEDDKPVASFECAAANNQAETSICNDYALSNLDRLLALVYRTTLHINDANLLADENADIVNDQRRWLNVRNDCADDISCLSQTYHSRLMSLTALWIGQQYDQIWTALSQEPSLEAVSDIHQRSIMVSKVDDAYEHILVFDPVGRLAYRSFDAPYDACTDEFSYTQELGPNTTILTREAHCNRYQFVRKDTVQLTPECIELVRLYEYPAGRSSDRTWLPANGEQLCAESTLALDSSVMWAWNTGWGQDGDTEDLSSEPVFNLMDAARHFFNYWQSPSITLAEQSDLQDYECPADDLALSYVKLLNFYHNLPFDSEADASFSEPMEYWSSNFGYSLNFLPERNPINNRFASLVDDYLRFEGIARPLLIMTLRALNQDSEVEAVLDDLLEAYNFTESPSELYRNSFYPCEKFKLVNGPLYDLTYWRGFDTYGFWQRRRADGTASFVYNTLLSLRDEIGA
ncbi:lysozyme inhibitor LprI family protein [Roseobacter sp. HKCCA0882]|uniref:lysozyme inhibitor LprI family protein n=1 Tax=Roseobacter sp. HKCCA0882 TaxID=3120337 RepID=UPI0030EF56F8